MSSIQTSPQAAVAFADLHQNGVAKGAISRVTEITNGIFHEILSQQELLQKDLRGRMDKVLAQQEMLLQQAQGLAGQQNQHMLAQAGEKMVRLLSLAEETDNAPGSHLTPAMYSEAYNDPSDIEDVEAALLEAERVITTTKIVGQGLSQRPSS